MKVLTARTTVACVALLLAMVGSQASAAPGRYTD